MRITCLAFAVFAACGVCPQREVLAQADGGVIACITSDHCPHADGVFLCTQTLDQQRGCIGCEANVCVRYVREVCK